MTTKEATFFSRGVAAGIIVGLALGLISALFIVLRPELFSLIVR